MTSSIRTGVMSPGFPRLVATGVENWAQHVRRYGPLPDARRLIGALEEAGLRGRGGAGFPTATKLRAMGRGGIVIANASEGEPLSRKDAVLLRSSPHLVLDGLLLTAAAVGAKRTAIVTKTSLEPLVRRAIADRADARDIEVCIVPEYIVAGEASAVANLVGRGVSRPTDRRVRLTESGVRGRPTLVQNAETLAHAALIGRFGAAWFRTVGTGEDPGTRLVTLCGDVARADVFEVPGGTTIAEILQAAGTDVRTVQAVLIGGYHGAWLPAAELQRTLADRALAPFGAAVGAGVLMVLGRGRCPIATTAEIVDYLAGQTAGQCGPCVNGLPALAEAVHRVAVPGRAPDVAPVRRAIALVDGRGACHHPDGTARLVRNTMQVFAAELAAHRHGRCEARA